MEVQYLTEESLGKVIEKIYPGVNFIRNKQVPDSGLKTKPDYRSDELMLIVEYDGYKHYTCRQTQERDNRKKNRYEEMGYKVVRVPFFVQMDTQTTKYYFDIDYIIETKFPHGFITETVTLPGDFNITGLERFLRECSALPSEIARDIDDSLFEQTFRLINQKGYTISEAIQTCYPPYSIMGAHGFITMDSFVKTISHISEKEYSDFCNVYYEFVEEIE